MKLPTKKDYNRVIEKLSSEISNEFPDICFYLYGSYVNGNCSYGRSDIDGGLILNSEFVSNPVKIRRLAEIFSSEVPYDIDVNLNLTDRGLNRDGRFLSYTPDYTDWIKEKGKVICGPDYVCELNGLDYKSGNLNAAAFNFRRIRNDTLEYVHDLKKGPEEVLKKVSKTLQGLKGFPKKLIWLQTGNVMNSYSENLIEIKKMLPNADLSVFEWVGDLFKNPHRYHDFVSNPSNAVRFPFFLRGVETLVLEYVKKFPEPSKFELRL